MKKSIRTIIQYVFFFGLGIFLVWWSIKDLSSDDKFYIKSALNNARYLLIVPVFFILILSHFVRALRWRLLIQPLGFNAATANTFFAVMIGYLANQAVPRLGEVLKCTVLARYEKIPADKLFGTIILERLIDGITLLLVFAITLIIQPDIYPQLMETFFKSSAGKDEKKTQGYIIVLILLGLVVVVILLWMIIKNKSVQDMFDIIKRILRSIWKGVSAIQHLRKRKLFLVYTFTIWLLYFIGGYVGFYALQETEQFGVKEAFANLSAGSIGMIATPGGIGAYPLIIEKTMQLYGLQKGVALAFGWLLWLSQTGVVLIVGLFSFVALPFYNKKRNIHAQG